MDLLVKVYTLSPDRIGSYYLFQLYGKRLRFRSDASRFENILIYRPENRLFIPLYFLVFSRVESETNASDMTGKMGDELLKGV